MWYINGTSYPMLPAYKSQVLIDVCSSLGHDIPRFCYHENLKIAGNRRMCLIEDSKSPKPVISCAGTASTELNIYTNTVQVKKSREAVMEFLLMNHPLDCPICDQAGECDSQDLALVYGADHGRFYDYKRNVEDKNCGPIIKTSMNRCILCTRCIRYATDLAGFNSFGLTGRGGKMEIGSYVEQLIDSELSGNLVDVCPVGALTSKPYSFAARPWELKKAIFVNVWDDQPQLLIANLKENDIIRILPTKNSTLVNRWITNRTRYSYQGLNTNRVLNPTIFGYTTNWEVFWHTFTNFFKTGLFNNTLRGAAILGINQHTSNLDYTDVSTIKQFLLTMGQNVNANNLSSTSQSFTNYIFLARMNLQVLFDSNTILLLSLNMTLEAPVLSFMINSYVREGNSKLSNIFLWRSYVSSPIPTAFLISDTALHSLYNFFQFKSWLAQLLNFQFHKPAIVSKIGVFAPQTEEFFKSLTLLTVSERVLIEQCLTYSTLDNNSQVNSITFMTSPNLQKTRLTTAHSTLQHVTHLDNDFLKLQLLQTPAKTILEMTTVYYNIDYKLFKSPLVITANYLAKKFSSIISLFASLLGVDSLRVLKPVILFSSKPFNLITDEHVTSLLQLCYYLNVNNSYRKITTTTAYYSEQPAFSNAPTIVSLAQYLPTHSIY